jgi:hypothetical protein
MTLIGYWPLNESSGSTAYDHSGNERHGEMKHGAGPSGTGTSKAPTGSTAYLLDGSDDNVPIDMKYDAQGEISGMTVCAWVKSSEDAPQVIMSFDRSEYWRLSIRRRDYGNGESTNIGLDTTDSAGNTVDMGTSQSFIDGNWHHVCGWFNSGSSEDKKIYVDGELVASQSAHGGNNLGTGMTRYPYIGMSTEAGSFDGGDNENYILNGAVCEVRLYNRPLTPREIQYLYSVSQRGRQVSSGKSS